MTVGQLVCVSGATVHLCVFVCSVFLVFPVPKGSGAAGVGRPLCFHHNEFPVHILSSKRNIYGVRVGIIM